jgi:hypothetical protein
MLVTVSLPVPVVTVRVPLPVQTKPPKLAEGAVSVQSYVTVVASAGRIAVANVKKPPINKVAAFGNFIARLLNCAPRY